MNIYEIQKEVDRLKLIPHSDYGYCAQLECVKIYNGQKMNIISETLKEHNLKVKEFIEFLKVTEGHYFYAVKKNDPIYMKGLEVRLTEFIDYKIVELEKESQ